MSALRCIVIIIPELPAVDATALAAEVVEQAVAPVVGPGAPGVDVDLGIAVGVVAEAVAEGALGPVISFGEILDGGGGLGVGYGDGVGGDREEVEGGGVELHFGQII